MQLILAKIDCLRRATLAKRDRYTGEESIFSHSYAIMSDFARQLLDLATRAGASDAEVYSSRSRSRPAQFEANRLKQLESSESEGIALRLWRDRRPGLAVAYGPVDPQTLVDRAIALSQLNSPEEEILLAPSRQAAHPQTEPPLPSEQLVATGKEAIARLRENYPEILCGGEWEWEREETHLLNTRGLDCRYAELTYGVAIGLEWVRGEDFLGIYDGQDRRDALPDSDSIVKSLLQRLEWAATNVAPPKGQVPVLLTPKAATLLWSTVSAALNGKRVQDGSSPWSDRLGETVAAGGLTLSQRPDFGPASCPFDDEGMPTRPLSLIEGGQVRTFYADLHVGKAIATGSTGNGFRPDMGRYPTPSLVNLVVEPGEGSLLDLAADIDDGIIIDQILGGGADISGDFSVNIDLGYRIQNGKLAGRVKDTMVAGNVYRAIEQILRLGSDREWSGSYYTPSVLVEGLSVVGS